MRKLTMGNLISSLFTMFISIFTATTRAVQGVADSSQKLPEVFKDTSEILANGASGWKATSEAYAKEKRVDAQNKLNLLNDPDYLQKKEILFKAVEEDKLRNQFKSLSKAQRDALNQQYPNLFQQSSGINVNLNSNNP